MPLLQLLRQEVRANPRYLLFLTVVAAVSTTLLLGIINMASSLVASGGSSLRLAFMFLVTVALFALSQQAVTAIVAREVEAMIDRMRLAMVKDIRRSDIQTIDSIGRAPLYAALTQDAQTISRSLPLLVIGSQQMAMLVFVCLYLAWLSMTAFVMAAGFTLFAIGLHLQRMTALGLATREVMAQEGQLFGGLSGLLRGLKEVRLNELRGEQVVGELAAVSAHARAAKTAIKARWAVESALIQLVFYLLVGLMVFVVPIFTSEFHQSVVQATTAVLFLIGPIGMIAQAIPAVGDAQHSLQEMQGLQQRLRQALADGVDESAEPLSAAVQDVTLEGIRYRYPSEHGDSGFAVGPLNARFRCGQITFITGGNGSGKSTMMRLLTGLMHPQQGALQVNGEALRPEQMQAWRDQISAVFADYYLFRRLYGVAPEALARAEALLQKLEMADKVHIRDGAFTTVDLSAGQRKRLALVVAELEDKPVLILDEWAADQDPHFRKLFYEELLPSFRARGKMVICVTHGDRWFDLADQILAMNEGQFEPGRAGSHHG